VFCPRCGDEYRPGFTECADCHVPLVVAPVEGDDTPAPAREPGIPDPDLELVTVLWSADTTLLPIAESILQSAGIAFITTNEGLRTRFAYGVGVGPVGIQVAADDADDARALLADLEDSEPDPEAWDDDEESA
jgi:hypothetical protein